MDTESEYVTTAGGNTTIVNGNEALMLAACVDSVPVVAAPGSMEDDSYVRGVFRRNDDVAGS